MARKLACLPRWSRRQTSVSQRTAALAVLRHGGSTIRSSRTRWAKASAHRVFKRDREQDCVRRPLFWGALARRRDRTRALARHAASPSAATCTRCQDQPPVPEKKRAGVQFRRAAINARAAWAVARTCTTRRTKTGVGACRAHKAGRRAALCAVRSRLALCTCSHLIESLCSR